MSYLSFVAIVNIDKPNHMTMNIVQSIKATKIICIELYKKSVLLIHSLMQCSNWEKERIEQTNKNVQRFKFKFM